MTRLDVSWSEAELKSASANDDRRSETRNHERRVRSDASQTCGHRDQERGGSIWSTFPVANGRDREETRTHFRFNLGRVRSEGLKSVVRRGGTIGRAIVLAQDARVDLRSETTAEKS